MNPTLASIFIVGLLITSTVFVTVARAIAFTLREQRIEIRRRQLHQRQSRGRRAA